jgi:hypothetical protein
MENMQTQMLHVLIGCTITCLLLYGDIVGLLPFSGLHFLHLSFDMANDNIRRNLRETDLWRAVGMVQQGAAFRQVGVAHGVHHTFITRAWERYRLH